ncbi:MAG: hypothetical protein V2I33_20535 [Kangiellaceae bacterium]|jgi:hypothetical protein|nr:hypothetical protein [Kangiellaceae bacterium]
MKPSEIYGYIEDFDKMFNDDRFTIEARLAMGGEFMRSLPPASLVTSASQTYRAAHNYMAARMQGALDAKAKRDAEPKVETTESKPTEKASVDEGKQTPSSNNANEDGRRSTVGKAPSNATKRRGKKSPA